MTAVPGGCVLVQPTFYRLSTDSWLTALTTGGGRAYGLYFNPKGGTFGALAENGCVLQNEEIGLPPGDEEPEGHWIHRFWLWDKETRRWDSSELAYACHQALASPFPTDARSPDPPTNGLKYPRTAPCSRTSCCGT
ncbi:hypothetical protein GCM10020000_74600 [Streptomyces olivoverticillatus]